LFLLVVDPLTKLFFPSHEKQVIDRDTGQPIDPPCKHRTLTKHKTLDPDWLELVSWQDVPRPPAALAIRVKVLDADKSLTGLAVAQPLGEVTLPLLCGSGPAEDKEHELERDGGRYLDRDYWYHLRPSPKMKAKTQLGIVQLRLSFNVAKRFDCKICGRSNTKTEAQRAGDQCRVCGAKPGRDVNPRIQPNDGVGDYLHGAFLRRQHTQFTIAREPLIIPEQEPIVTERTIRPDADEEPGTFTEKLLKSGAGF
jgi:transcription elongation factor Elf1